MVKVQEWRQKINTCNPSHLIELIEIRMLQDSRARNQQQSVTFAENSKGHVQYLMGKTIEDCLILIVEIFVIRKTVSTIV